VEPRTGSWARYQDHNGEGVFCLLFSASKKAGRRKGETFATIPFASSLRMHATPTKKETPLIFSSFFKPLFKAD